MLLTECQITLIFNICQIYIESFTRTVFPQELPVCGTGSRVSAFLNTTILTFHKSQVSCYLSFLCP